MEGRRDVDSTNTDPHIILAIDFDGTMMQDDVGDTLFQTFGEFEPVHSELLSGKMSVAEYYQRSAQLLRPELTPAAMHEFAMERQVDPGLVPLVNFCEEHAISVVVVSDGFDAYIRPVLDGVNLSNLPVHCNTLSFLEGAWVPQFPGATESCSCFCASCKRNAVLGHVDDRDILIYVGDGLSDTCAARHADIIFAKKKLAAWCNEERLPHHTYRTLFDVQRILATRVATSDLRSRRQALLARRSAFASE